MPRPWITTNLAISADGKITSVNRQPCTWTSRDDFNRLLKLRETADALLIGRNTVETDRMSLTVPGAARQPLRCIISRSGDLSPDLPVFQNSGGAVHLLITGNTPHDPAHPLSGKSTIHHGDLADFLETLASRHGVKHLHCEGGGHLIRTLAELDLIDEFHLTLAGHTLFGGTQAPTTTGVPAEFLPQSLLFEITHFEPRPDFGECFLTYRRAGHSKPVQ